MGVCLTPDDVVLQMGGTALALFLLTLLFGHFASSKPLDQLGVRPMGSGLWSYFYHHFIDSVGGFGYDSILGSWSPPIRLGFHVSMIWSLVALAVQLFVHGDDDDDEACVADLTIVIWASGAIVVYMAFFYVYFHCMPNVSHPGGPRPHKIQRMPQWDNQTTTMLSGDSLTTNWRCAVAQDSHDATEHQFEGTCGVLSGEPVGRQIWTLEPPPKSQAKQKRVDEKLVQEMASGGRSDGFNPSDNPNR